MPHQDRPLFSVRVVRIVEQFRQRVPKHRDRLVEAHSVLDIVEPRFRCVPLELESHGPCPSLVSQFLVGLSIAVRRETPVRMSDRPLPELPTTADRGEPELHRRPFASAIAQRSCRTSHSCGCGKCDTSDHTGIRALSGTRQSLGLESVGSGRAARGARFATKATLEGGAAGVRRGTVGRPEVCTAKRAPGDGALSACSPGQQAPVTVVTTVLPRIRLNPLDHRIV